MAVFVKRKKSHMFEENRRQLEYLYEAFLKELRKIDMELNNLDYQIDFFGISDKLIEEKQDIFVLRTWIKHELDEMYKKQN